MDLKEQIKKDMGPAIWSDLNMFVKRGTLFHIDESYDLLDVAHKIATDDGNFIKTVIENKKLIRMDHDTFNTYTERKFICAIVDPFVVFQFGE